jgi:hypothetical protein
VADGDVADGDVADGEVVDGELVDGEELDGEVVDGDVVDGEVVVGEVFPPFDPPFAPVVRSAYGISFSGGLGTAVSDLGRTSDSTDSAAPSVQEDPPPWTRVQVLPVTLMTAVG